MPTPSAVMPAYDVLLFGDYFCDLIFTGLLQVPRLGAELFGTGFDMVPGGAFTTAAALHRLGVRVGWACDFGGDLLSQYVLEAARREGLDGGLFRHHAAPVRRITVAFSFPHDRGFISYVDRLDLAAPYDAIAQHRPRCVMLHELPFRGEQRSAAALTHQSGGVVYLDCQHADATLDTPGVADTLRAVDIFAPNAAEAMQLTGAPTPEDALGQLAELTSLVIVKCGADGALAQQAGRVLHAPAIPVEVVDTTGAGDAFNAGFLSAYMRGEPLEKCLRVGNICGGLSTTMRGGAAASPTRAQVEAWLERR
jgi:sugar/nucleoside kinase (ribokinase family)